ncbi:unnamed protein product, partial [Ectocarpus sp. 6 AP-2014]
MPRFRRYFLTLSAKTQAGKRAFTPALTQLQDTTKRTTTAHTSFSTCFHGWVQSSFQSTVIARHHRGTMQSNWNDPPEGRSVLEFHGLSGCRASSCGRYTQSATKRR